ncbi:MAG: BamA/TamA family outer membrane protein [Phascolarctobacterium sp.]|nr:BamA/TamA family outer membrane protein [Phascolarctobacterium sp.]
MKKKLLILAMTGLMLNSVQVNAAPPIPDERLAEVNAGVQMNRLNDYIEREREAMKIAKDQKNKTAKVEGTDTSKTPTPDVKEIKFKLKKLVTDASVVLTADEIKTITKDYEDKEVTVNDLYKAVERINDLYAQKGHITCKAFLLQQTIKDGTVKITLVEGKTGDVSVINNNWTKDSYIKKRVKLANGQVTNINELNTNLLRFNATNDVQLRILMHAGQKPGTTDYVITAYEPEQYTWNVFVDNSGNKNNGEIREGVFFTAKSVSGSRDALTVGSVNSRGSKAVTSSYSHSLGRSGTKMNVGYNTNSVKTVKGEYKDMIKGHSNSVSLGITQPWIINEKTRSEAVLEMNHQKSSTDFRTGSTAVRIVEDKINDALVGFAMTNYGNSHVFYQKHGIMLGRAKSDVHNDSETYGIFKTNGFYQKAYAHGQSISARGEAQWSSKDNVPSARQFYIGGANSVRGYEENFRGADKGINLSVEYAVPLNEKKTIKAFTFLDYGQLFGEDAESSNVNEALVSTGIGIKADIAKSIYANLTMGVPLKKHFDDGHKEPSSVKLHFMVSGQF